MTLPRTHSTLVIYRRASLAGLIILSRLRVLHDVGIWRDEPVPGSDLVGIVGGDIENRRFDLRTLRKLLEHSHEA